MRILILTVNSSLLDGINRHILNVVSVLNSYDDIEVAVCTVWPKGDLNKELELLGIRTFSLNESNGHKLGIIPKYIKVLRSFKPEIIHVHVMSLMIRFVSAVGFHHIKYVHTIHGLADKVVHVTLRMRLERIFVSLFNITYSATLYISKGVMEAAGGKRDMGYSEVVYNPIDFNCTLQRKVSLYELIGVSNSVPIIGTACRIAKVKQPELFTEVMCNILMIHEDVHAVVIGDGDIHLINNCKRIIDKYAVNNRFHWLGYRKDSYELISSMNCFLLTSISEGLPTSLLECMSLKVPFAFLKGNGGLNDISILNKKYGPFAIEVKPNDIEDFIQGISILLKSKSMQKELAERAYQVGKKFFDVNNVADKLVNIYRSILSQ